MEEKPQGKINIPTKLQVLQDSAFGKPSLQHSFTSQACFEHTLIFLLKNNFLDDSDTMNLLSSHPLFQHLHKMLTWSSNISFMDIRDPIKNYADQKSIDTSRVKTFQAAIIHYNLDIPTLIRFLGNNYTGEYRQSKKQ